MPGWEIIKAAAGRQLDRTFTWKAGNPAVPVNLTGYDARLVVRESLSSPILASWSVDSGHLVLGGVLGTITLTVPKAEMLELAPADRSSQFRTGLELTPPGDNPDQELVEGWLLLRGEVAR